jgi:hypothetical protein
MALFIDLVLKLTYISKNRYLGGINSTTKLILLHIKSLKQFTSIAFNHALHQTMKYTLTLICFILFQSLHAQPPLYSAAPDFTATDTNPQAVGVFWPAIFKDLRFIDPVS